MEKLGTGGEPVRDTIIRPVSPRGTGTGGETIIIRPVSPCGTGTGGETIIRPVSPRGTGTGGETIIRPVSLRGTGTGEETARPVSPRGRPTRAGKTPRRERAAGQRHRASKSSRVPETPGRTETKQRQKEEEGTDGTAEDKQEGTGRCTVVDVDSVRQKVAQEDRDELLYALLETDAQEEGVKQRGLGVCEWLLMVVVLSLVLLFLPLSIWFCVQVVREHERAVIFRLGHLLRGRPRGPGLLFYLPFLDVCQKVDIRLKMLKVPPHTVMTKDLLSADVSAVCYYRVENVLLCTTSVSDVTTLLQAAVTQAVRAVLSRHAFTHVLMHRTDVGQQVQTATDALVCPWGVRVERTEIEDVCLPAELQLSLSAEAEAKRQAHVKVIMAEGERAACQALQSSLNLLSSASPAAAVHLRLLQHLLFSCSSELLPLTPDLLPLPLPPPPPPPEAVDTDSPMM